ncbi:MAG: 4Fe-4S binding protein [Desulfopila sp.]
MGHHAGDKSSIVPLIDRLNRYPIGLPDSERLRQILAILFSEDAAYVASRFPLQEATVNELARATGWDRGRLLPVLEEMADRGLVMDMRYGKRTYYLLLPGLIGFFELTFMKQRQDLPARELAQLMHDYLYEDTDKGMAREFFGSSTPLTRSLVYEEHIPVHSAITTWESAREIVKNAGYGAVGMCYCRHKKSHLDQQCDKGAPVEEICISLGNAARFMVRRGFARERSVDQLLALLDRARELHLTHITDNIRHKPSFICNCCSCCCELLGGVLRGYPDGVAKAGYTLTIDERKCRGCGLCQKACNAQALTRVATPGGRSKHRMTVDIDRCLGCGACVSSCQNESLALRQMTRPEPPEKKRQLFARILREKNRLTPFVLQGVKNAVLRKIGLG